ncbi:diguanylate cyclase : Diguanylate cyclase (GGDEF) domain-containing protein OS=Mycobacterium sp. (strain Spyr1) GN=Mspyr1_39150 PE=4 SV=1: GAF_2 [Gemmata massiliana]|uniref:GAF domain-containing protein n=1 Tax=Gemmata massiliana TaxID=1210884 RepID=A0A6P2CUJ9_9BACT|nr:GAF domain-containing protein [Gemmata massiliana]VTR92661.1 diguanylate cyclase : Diguanylate cyclase (GGDEF) domain-containing protein OS=Mycobacterium sp. (strain Spyr1) GN=Mspyr1_39150 PE=4 SV=1: GAF_2 [Gemmata massiliana]
MSETTKPAPAEATEQLIDAVQRLSSARNTAEITNIVKVAARRVTGADGACFVLRDEEKCYYVDEDAIAPLWKGKRFPMEACISGWVMRNRQPALIPDIYLDDRIPHDAYRVTFVKSLAVVPIRSLGPVGAIGVYWAQTACPTPTEVRWLQSLADSTALALEYVRSQTETNKARGMETLLRSENTRLRDAAQRPTAGGLVRMCFLTKRFEVNGQWVPVEALLEQWFSLHVTHGLSPEGIAQLALDRNSRVSADDTQHDNESAASDTATPNPDRVCATPACTE